MTKNLKNPTEMKVKYIHSVEKGKCKHEWELIIREGECFSDLFRRKGTTLYAHATCKKCGMKTGVVWE